MQRDRIARLLPGIYQAAAVREGEPLAAVLDVMAGLQAPVETRLDELDAIVDPHRAEDALAFMLADWLGLGGYLEWSGGRAGAGRPHFSPGLGRLRLLIAEVPDLIRSRGSRAALERFLAVATGIGGITVQEGPPDAAGQPQPFHLLVRAPAAARRYAPLVERIVENERPAYATYQIAYADS